MEYKFTALDDVEVKADARTVRGYASVFGNVDSYNDTIVKGAYSATIKANPRGIKMLWQHNPEKVIGRWHTLKEDDKGLVVEGDFTPGHSLADDAYASVKADHVDGISIGFSIPPGGSSERSDGVRVLKKINLSEASIVTFPADSHALITGVKAIDLQFRELRSLLQDAARERGLPMSRTEAEALLLPGFKNLTATRDAGGQPEPETLKSALLEAIRKARI
jgi:HK97 family phage prohead protease